MLHVKDQVLCEYLWILKHLGKVEHAAAGATRFIDYSNPVGHCLGSGLLVDEFCQAFTVGQAGSIGGEAWFIEKMTELQI